MPDEAAHTAASVRHGHDQLARPAKVELHDESASIPRHEPLLRPSSADTRHGGNHIIRKIVGFLQAAARGASVLAHLVRADSTATPRTLPQVCPARRIRTRLARHRPASREMTAIHMTCRPMHSATERFHLIRQWYEMLPAVPAAVLVTFRSVAVAPRLPAFDTLPDLIRGKQHLRCLMLTGGHMRLADEAA